MVNSLQSSLRAKRQTVSTLTCLMDLIDETTSPALSPSAVSVKSEPQLPWIQQ